MRTRREIKRDRQDHYAGLEKLQDPKAGEVFRRPAYQARKMVQDQGRQMEHKTELEYLSGVINIKEGVGADGQRDA